jgi:nitrogen regulatory protein PII-like uncharacterized protein
MKDPSVTIVDGFKLNAIKDPYELIEIATSHKNPEFCKAALDKIIKMNVMEERKAILICTVAKKTCHKSVAKHAFGYCAISTLSDDSKARMIKKALNEMKFESIKKEMERWLKEHGY